MKDRAMARKAEPDFILHGRTVVGGVTEGEALVTRDTISGWGGINPMTGFDRNPLDCIQMGDWIRIDAHQGTEGIWKNKSAF